MNFLIGCITFVLGNLIVQQLSELPVLWMFLIIFFIGVILFLFTYYYRCFKWASVIAGLLLGFTWTYGWASYHLADQLPEEWIKKDVQVIGQVISIPQYYSHHVSFRFRVEAIMYQGKRYSSPHYLQLSWYEDQYNPSPVPIPELKTGQTWKLTVRLKPPQGFASPFASDHSQYLFSQHIGAVGYVYTKHPPELLSEKIGWRDRINHYRETLAKEMREILYEKKQSGIIEALAIGEKSNITTEEWKVLQATGTSHLVAISGLHIGLVAGLVLGLSVFMIKRFSFFNSRYPSIIISSFFALAAAIIYSALAGFAIPTQRALIMLSLVTLCLISQRSFARIYTFAAAWVLVLLWDPLATLSVSFWLSFIAVGTLFYLLSGKLLKSGKKERIKEWAHFQWGISVLLIPVTLWFFQQTPLVSPIANAIAIPWVSFVVVPLTLLGCFFINIVSPLGVLFLEWAAYAMQAIWFLMEWFASWPYATWQYTLPNMAVFFSLIMAVIILFLPKGFPGRFFSVIAFLPVLFINLPRPNIGEVWIDILDVGQGLAVVARTANHILLYDSGDQFSDRLNAATAVILPFLRGTGVQQLDVLTISHSDRDHMGGANTLLQEIPIKKLIAGDRWKTQYAYAFPCYGESSWIWDEVLFTFLHPHPEDSWEGNNASCVLKISSGSHSVLLTGDIESAAEKRLLTEQFSALSSTFLIAPHHGSRTSSTLKFVKAVNPDYVIFPAGYLNRFRFPNAKIVERYIEQGALAFTTATHGTIRLVFDAQQFASPLGFREQFKRYWHRN